ncbi:MAG: TIR domain-containing protein [Pseudomonadales bacterium]
MAERPFPAYRGDEPYVFVSYSHVDADVVYPELRWLKQQGFNIWYDEGISAGTEWRQELAQAIQNCALLLFYVSPRSVNSPHCIRELNFALDEGKPYLAIHLEPTELPAAVRMSISGQQGVVKHALSNAQYLERLPAALRTVISGETSWQPIPRPSPNRQRVWGWSVAIALAISGTVAGILFLWPRGPDVLSDTIAVMAFRNLSQDEDSAYLAFAIPNSINRRLSGIAGLRVLAPGRRQPRELRASAILEGSVFASGDQLRVTVQLLDAARNVVWSDIHDRAVADVFSVEAEIAKGVVEKLAVALGAEEALRLSKQPTASPQAYKLFTQGLYRFRLADFEHAEDYLLRALEIDPDFALAHTVLAMLYANLSRDDEARAAAETALRLDADAAQAHWVLALQHIEQRQWPAARAQFRAALRSEPNSGVVLATYARLLSWLGEFDQAIELANRALEVDPTSYEHHIYAAEVHRLARRFRSSAALLEKLADIDPARAGSTLVWGKSLTYVETGQCVKALAVAESEHETASTIALRAYLHRRCNQPALAREQLERLRRLVDNGDIQPLRFEDWFLTAARLGIGDNDEALAGLERMVRAGVVPPWPPAPLDPFWDPVRGDARFMSLAERMGLPASL